EFALTTSHHHNGDRRKDLHRKTGDNRPHNSGAHNAAASFKSFDNKNREILASDPRPPQIAIIGAGISGLTAALTLSDVPSTLDITVFEADSYIGGRIHDSGKDILLNNQ
ncbi:unnamed protein product, partial [Didymodactylos carnosus]